MAVVVGSTFKMGLGVNVQERLCALHHLDVPWRPADMVQREGRILRQGNQCDSVQIFRYITKGSFDAYSWQLLEKKQRFISQILSGTALDREGEDVDETVLNYAEVKALSVGNPLIKQKVEITNEIDKLRILQRDYVLARQKMEHELNNLPAQIEAQKQLVADVKADMKYYRHNKIDYDSLSYEEQKDIRQQIYQAVTDNVNKPVETKVLTYQGFDVVVPAHMLPKTPQPKPGDDAKSFVGMKIPYVSVRRQGAYHMEVQTEMGITKRLNNLLEHLDAEKKRREDHLKTLKNKQANLQAELKKQGTSYADEISRLAGILEEIDEQLGVAA